MIEHFSDYDQDFKKLFIKVFGQDIFNDFNKIELKVLTPGVLDIDHDPTSPNINERFNNNWIEFAKKNKITPFNLFTGVVWSYGIQQCKDHDVLDAKKHLELIRAMTLNTDISEVEKLEEKEKTRKDFSEYMESSKQLMTVLFGFKLYNRIKNIKLVAFDWDGLDISTSSILATTPGIKERFSEAWVKYFSDKDYSALDLFLQSIFHYGYQYGVDNYLSEVREITNSFLNNKLTQKQ